MEWNSTNNGEKMLCQENKLAVIIAIGICLIFTTIFGGIWVLCRNADNHKVEMSKLGYSYTYILERKNKDISYQNACWMKGDGSPIVVDVIPNTKPRKMTIEEASKFLREELKK